jgi:hypothetical protein
VSFTPPRDGKQLTEPVPVVGRSPALSSASGASSPPKSRDTSVDPLAQELIPRPSSGHGASSTTASSHAPSDNENLADGSDDEDVQESLAGELRQLGYTD